jgi:hypothetical protein
MLTVWPAADRAVVLLVAPHSGKAGDVDDQLLSSLGVEPSADERAKPSCCDDEGGPPVDEATAEAIRAAVEASVRRSRGRR